MKWPFFIAFCVSIILCGCEYASIKHPFYLDKVGSGKYYSTEIIPESYKGIYGSWHLTTVFEGWGGSIKPPFDYLEIKSMGIYGIVQNNVIIETGKIEVVSFDQAENKLVIRFISDPQNTHVNISSELGVILHDGHLSFYQVNMWDGTDWGFSKEY